MLKPSRPIAWSLAFGMASILACARQESGKPPTHKAAMAPPEQPPNPSPTAQSVTAASQALPAPTDEPKPGESFLDPGGTPMSPSMVTADRWLRALRDGDEAALTNATQYPFVWRSTDRLDCPAKQPAETAEELSPIVTCLFTDGSLRRALPEHDLGGISELPPGRLQDWAQPWRQDARPGATLVNAFVKRSDLQLDMDLWVVDGSVQAFWMHPVDGASEVASYEIPSWGERWLQAGRHANLKKVSAGAYAHEGFSFDMVVLVDTAGVRALWMYGSLESND